MSRIVVRKVNIVRVKADAIVNAANERLQAGGGVCGHIFQAAGHKKLQEACNKIGHCPTGRAVITKGFDLPATFIIHAVGPVWRGGNNREPQLLYSCYKRSLDLAKEYNCKSIVFPLISAGIFCYPVEKAWNKAIQACIDFIDKNEDYNIDIAFAVIDDEVLARGQKILEKALRSHEMDKARREFEQEQGEGD